MRRKRRKNKGGESGKDTRCKGFKGSTFCAAYYCGNWSCQLEAPSHVCSFGLQKWADPRGFCPFVTINPLPAAPHWSMFKVRFPYERHFFSPLPLPLPFLPALSPSLLQTKDGDEGTEQNKTEPHGSKRSKRESPFPKEETHTYTGISPIPFTVGCVTTSTGEWGGAEQSSAGIGNRKGTKQRRWSSSAPSEV